MRLILLLLSIALTANAQYTEFYINNGGGGNTNSGHTADASPTFSAQNGFWTNYTGYGVFFKAGMSLTAVTNGAWAAVYTNDSTATAFIGIITNVDDTGDFIFVKTVEAKAGTTPTQDDLNGKTHITVGGAWFGPKSGTSDATSVATNTFPFAMIATTMTNGPGLTACVNIKGGTEYFVTNSLANANVGPWIIQGYTNTVHDMGKATIDAVNWTGVAFKILDFTANNNRIADLIVANNSSGTGANDGISQTGSGTMALRCVAHNIRKNGFVGSANNWAISCEAYYCNINGGANGAGINAMYCVNCISHHNLAANSSGFFSPFLSLNSIAYSNSFSGFEITTSAGAFNPVLNCIAVSNSLAGVRLTGVGPINIQNCIIAANGSGITNSSAVLGKVGNIANCAFGSGTQFNLNGNTTNFYGIDISGSITIPVDTLPWVDASTGNFCLSASSALKSAGLAAFTETFSGYSGTISYPDVGAVQSPSTNATASGTSAHTFAQ